MRIALIGPAQDLHLRRWGRALQAAGAEVVFVGLEPPPSDVHPYHSVGPPVTRPRWVDFYRRAGALRRLLETLRVAVAHPFHLTPSGVWVWLSGFRPYVPYAMGADLLEYTPGAPPLRYSWSLQSASPALPHLAAAWLRRRLLPPLLRQTLQEAAFALADNYELCKAEKFFVKEKNYIELPTGPERVGDSWEGEGRIGLLFPRGLTPFYRADILLEAAHLYLAAQGRLLLFCLAGPYPPHPHLTRQAKDLEKRFPNKFFFFEKILDKKEMAKLWRRSLAFVSAPLYDGYSYSLAEGRAYGALPIIPALPAYLELLTHGYNAWFVEPFTPENLCQAFFAVEKYLTEPPFWPARNLAWVERFSDLRRSAEAFLSLLQAYLDRQPKEGREKQKQPQRRQKP